MTNGGAEGDSAMTTPEGTYSYNLPLELALEAANEAVRVGAVNGHQVTATVVNLSGVPQVVLRGDGATIHTSTSSFEKAYTVVTLGPIFQFDTSSAFYELVKSNPFAPELAKLPNVMALPGAVAFKVNGQIVAALGVGGAPGGDKDEIYAQAGIDKIARRLTQ
jgi:uncharacterized protein GlcG (DUF336 family)